MMTNALYLQDSYLQEFSAKVLEAEGNKIILDQTAFYPESGGQLADNGKLMRGDEEFSITNVRKGSGSADAQVQNEIVHFADKEGLKENDEIKGIIDWQRRYQMMRMHTAAHILSAIVNTQTGALITGNQLGLEKSRIDFDLENFNREEIKNYFQSANDIVKWDLPIMVDVVPMSSIINDKKLCKLAKGLPPGLKDVRIVEIEMFDRQADGGTHVKFTKEVGKIEFIDAENKGANNRRIYFKLS
jgi:Ser-tRNA(Ala) deacylase AlaX